jgi:hypothetical protein
MSNAAPPESNPIPRVVPPHTTEARPAANVALTAQQVWMRAIQRRPQKVVTTLRNANSP